MRRWKSRVAALTTGFTTGLLLVFICSFLAGHLALKRPLKLQSAHPQQLPVPSACADEFASPEDLLSALKSQDVSARRDVYRRLFLHPGMAISYYDYERDRDYPERADFARLQYVRLDNSPDAEALITFVRFEYPVAVILKKSVCGWRVIAGLSAWLRFEDYPYRNWIELPEMIEPGVHELLIRDSTGDATRYVRKVRILKLVGDSLEQVAEFEEEAITPLDNYHGADWSDVKYHRSTRYDFFQESTEQAARIRLETASDVVKYSAAAPAYTYWSETDGAWHVSPGHWRSRPAKQIKSLDTCVEQLVWDKQRKRFVEEQ